MNKGFVVNVSLGFEYAENFDHAVHEAQRVLRDSRIPTIYTVINKETHERRNIITNE